jgi:hypothetical protein
MIILSLGTLFDSFCFSFRVEHGFSMAEVLHKSEGAAATAFNDKEFERGVTPAHNKESIPQDISLQSSMEIVTKGLRLVHFGLPRCYCLMLLLFNLELRMLSSDRDLAHFYSSNVLR